MKIVIATVNIVQFLVVHAQLVNLIRYFKELLVKSAVILDIRQYLAQIYVLLVMVV